MPTPIPNIASGFTSGFTVDYTSTAANVFDYETFNWTPVQRLLNLDYSFLDLTRATKLNLNILRRAMALNKITKRYYRN